MSQKIGKCKRVGKFLHCPIKPKGAFDPRSFRVKVLPKGKRLVVACPKGQYSSAKQKCKVGTVAQKLLKPIK